MTTNAAYVLIQPRAFEHNLSDEEIAKVDELVQSFWAAMDGQSLIVAIQAVGVLTADLCGHVSKKGGESIFVLQDIAARGQEWIKAGEAAQAVVEKVAKRRRRRQVAKGRCK